MILDQSTMSIIEGKFCQATKQLKTTKNAATVESFTAPKWTVFVAK